MTNPTRSLVRVDGPVERATVRLPCRLADRVGSVADELLLQRRDVERLDGLAVRIVDRPERDHGRTVVDN
jgi:hypothetical protein